MLGHCTSGCFHIKQYDPMQVISRCRPSLYAYPGPESAEAATSRTTVPVAVLSTTARARERAQRKAASKASRATVPSGDPEPQRVASAPPEGEVDRLTSDVENGLFRLKRNGSLGQAHAQTSAARLFRFLAPLLVGTIKVLRALAKMGFAPTSLTQPVVWVQAHMNQRTWIQKQGLLHPLPQLRAAGSPPSQSPAVTC